MFLPSQELDEAVKKPWKRPPDTQVVLRLFVCRRLALLCLSGGVERLMLAHKVSSMRNLFRLSFILGALALSLAAQEPQQPQGSSSSTGQHSSVDERPTARPSAGLAEAGGASITLESSETLFDLAAGLNACGYDADLADSDPVRAQIRKDLAKAAEDATAAKTSQNALCKYFDDHKLNDGGRTLAQYISLALYLGPPPALNPIADQTQMPPDSLQVLSVLPLLRTFSEQMHLHAIWMKHRAQYQAITDQWHQPVTQAVVNTNIYLKMPVSSYDGRRMLILIEPLLAPNAPNARIYATDYIMVTSPTSESAIRMDQIRHMYLHYELEPLVYGRATSMQRLTPLLKPVADAPLEYIYKTDVVALVTECMIKAIEARTMDTAIVAPQKPGGTRDRVALARYNEEMTSFERGSEQVRRKQIDLDMRQGWTMSEYFYNQMALFEHNPEGLSESMGQMVYGMDVERERHHDEQISFLPEGSGEFVRRAPKAPTGVMLAEKMMLEGHLDQANAIADKALADPAQDHADALYLKARVELMEGDPEDSMVKFEEVAKSAQQPRTAAWAHIYMGRLYDIKEPTERDLAMAEYKAALTIPGAPQDARAAAQGGLKTPFSVPKIKHEAESPGDPNGPPDPSGKKEKDAYKPE